MKDTPEGRERIDSLNSIASELIYSEPQRAMELSEQAYKLSAEGDGAEQPYKKGLAESQLNLGRLNLLAGEDTLGLEWLCKALSLSEESQTIKDQIIIKTWVGYAYLCKEDYVEALNYFNSVQLLLEGVNEPVLNVSVLTHLGSMYVELGQSLQALTYLDQGLQLARLNNEVNIQAEVLSSSCRAYHLLGDLGNAIQSGLLSLRLFTETGRQRGVAQAQINLGEVYLTMGEDELALGSFCKALDIAQKYDWSRLQAESLSLAGEAYFHQGMSDQAMNHLTQAAEIASQFDDKRVLSRCHQYLALIEDSRGDHAAAYKHLQQHHKLEEDLARKTSRGLQDVVDFLHQEKTSRLEAEIHQLKSISLQEEVHIRQQAEDALKSTNQRLREEIQEREKLIAELDAFSHMVAHDLKSPLQSTITSISLLTRILSEKSDIEVISALKALDKSTGKMNRIIDELLVLSGVRKQEVSAQPLNMGEIMQEVEARLAHMIEHNKAVLIIHESWPQAMGYAPWVEEIWDNFISNAIKYGGRPPRVEIGATPSEDGFVRFWIKDNGNGIRPEEHDKVFVEFTRLDRIRVRGHGLGLAIVRRIVEKLGGEVGVESDGLPGKGSTFSFTLPSVL